MNIKITYNWLREYLDTEADPYELQKYLSLCGPSIERIDKVDDDYVLDIEVTSNRVDMASVFGIAQEAQAILPMFGKKAIIKNNPLEKYTFKDLTHIEQSPLLKVKITDPKLCSRFTALVINDVVIKQSPEIIKKRLMACDIKSINCVVDISNYLMLALGQPTHVFDYDKIKKAKMTLRESKAGEKITTLDDKELTLPGGDIVIEDGSGKLIDLCGVMGGLNSSVTDETKNVLLFVQTYNKHKIRKTSMLTGQRTVAATYFEKGLDEERVQPTIMYGLELFNKHADGKQGSNLTDIYPQPYSAKMIPISIHDIKRVIGIDITSNLAAEILQHLGFRITQGEEEMVVAVPSWRKDDIDIKEDIIEEIARVYGYHNLPNNIQPIVHIRQPIEIAETFKIQHKAKYFLKHIGLHESMNYSMISEKLLNDLEIKTDDHIVLANTISEEIKIMRRSLLPSLIKNMKENEGKKEVLKFFEIAKVYEPREGELPAETYRLSFAVNTNLYDLKGIIEALLREFHIDSYNVTQNSDNSLLAPNAQGSLSIEEKPAGYFGQLSPIYKNKLELKKDIYLAELEFDRITRRAKLLPSYRPINPFATIKLDLTLTAFRDLPYAKIEQSARLASPLLQTVELVEQYKDKITIRFYFSSTEKNITEEEAKQELEKIKTMIK